MTKRPRDVSTDAAVAGCKEPAAKRVKMDGPALLRVLAIEGVYDPLPPCCSNKDCKDADIRRSDQGEWVCIGCGWVLGANLEDGGEVFDDASAGRSRSSAKPVDIEGAGRLAAAARKLDGSDVERRYQWARKSLEQMCKDARFGTVASNSAVLKKATDYLHSYMVDCKNGELHQRRVTLAKIALICLQRAAAEHRIAFDAALVRDVLHDQNDSKVRAEDKVSVARLRSDIEAKLKLPALPWATVAHGHVTQLCASAAKLSVKEETAARRLVDWFADCATSQELKTAAVKPGQRGVKKAHSIRDTAANLLAVLPAEQPAAAAAKSDTDKGISAASFGFLACWLVCDRVSVPDSISVATLAHLKRVFQVYALAQMSSNNH